MRTTSKEPSKTRKKIMDEAQALILNHGFGATTVDAIIQNAGVSKGAFFHHFSSKSELGYELVKRYAKEDVEHLNKTLNKSEGLSDDPLQQLLISIKLFEQEMQNLEEPYPGCLFASYCYQSELFDENILEIIRETMITWRKRIQKKLTAIADKYPPKKQVDLESLADMLLVVFEGAFVMSQSLEEAKTIARQLSHYHTYLSLLFDPNG